MTSCQCFLESMCLSLAKRTGKYDFFYEQEIHRISCLMFERGEQGTVSILQYADRPPRMAFHRMSLVNQSVSPSFLSKILLCSKYRLQAATILSHNAGRGDSDMHSESSMCNDVTSHLNWMECCAESVASGLRRYSRTPPNFKVRHFDQRKDLCYLC